jgi:hypothetical protein
MNTNHHFIPYRTIDEAKALAGATVKRLHAEGSCRDCAGDLSLLVDETLMVFTPYNESYKTWTPESVELVNYRNPESHAIPSFMEPETGLPFRCTGDVVTPIMKRANAGHNAGLREFILEHSLPWNSRKRWINEIIAPKEYFEARQRTQAPHLFEPGCRPTVSPDGLTTIALGETERDVTGVHTFLAVTSVKRWPSEVFSASGIWDEDQSKALSVPRPDVLPVLGQKWAQEPITFPVWLWIYDDASRIEMFWGPGGSELAFFRFTDGRTAHCAWPTRFGILDLHLFEWLPSSHYTQSELERCGLL